MINFVQCGHKDFSEDGVVWREPDGAATVTADHHDYLEDCAVVHAIMCVRATEALVSSAGYPYADKLIPPHLHVIPFFLSAVIVADILDKLHGLEPPLHVDGIEERLYVVARMYGHTNDSNLYQFVIGEEQIKARAENYPPPEYTPTQETPEGAITEKWLLRNGVIIRMCDMSDRHVLNAARYKMGEHAARHKTIPGVIDFGAHTTMFPNAILPVREAQRRGLLTDLLGEYKRCRKLALKAEGAWYPDDEM